MEWTIRCRTGAYKKKAFRLVFDEGIISLFDEEGKHVLSFGVTNVDKYARFPSFSESVKYFSLLLDGKLLAFDMDRSAVKELRKACDMANLGQDPEFAASLRRKGLLQIVFGLAGIVAGPVLSYLSYQSAKPGGRYYVWYGFSVVGLAALVRGIVTLRRGRALAEHEPEESNPFRDEHRPT